MDVKSIWLKDYRNYAEAWTPLACSGLTVVKGDNGQGKTNLLEAVAWLATARSFRGVSADALVRRGQDRAVVRAEVQSGSRELLVEAELSSGRAPRVWVNRQLLRTGRDLVGMIRATVFSADDLALVKGGPSERRRYLDDALVSLHPANDALERDVERVLRQRGALLRQSGGRGTEDVLATLDVWDAQLSRVGTMLSDRRQHLLARLQGPFVEAYRGLAADGTEPTLTYRPSWEEDLRSALAARRREDLQRGVTTVGPHRDDLSIELDGLPSRSHASQGEQRTLALALRLATHATVTAEIGESPVLLLDDVFSELDPSRCSALLAQLPPGQAVLATTGGLPSGIRPDAMVSVSSGELESWELDERAAGGL